MHQLPRKEILLLSVSGSQHELRPDLVVELFRSELAEGKGGFLEGKALLVSLLGDGSDVIVTQSAVQAGSQHQTLVHNLLNPVLVRLDTDDTVLGETPGTIRQESDRLQEVLDENGFENVQFELAV